jgi:hypothetical protein
MIYKLVLTDFIQAVKSCSTVNKRFGYLVLRLFSFSPAMDFRKQLNVSGQMCERCLLPGLTTRDLKERSEKRRFYDFTRPAYTDLKGSDELLPLQ